MPDTLRRFAEVLDDMHAKHRFLAESLGGRWRPDSADEVIASIEGQAKELRELLTDPARTSFTWVTLPEELPIEESKDGVEALEKLGVAVERIVVNRVWPMPPHACAYCTPRFEAERAALARIDALFPKKQRLTIPAVPREPRGVDALLNFSACVRPPVAVRRRAKDTAPRRKHLANVFAESEKVGKQFAKTFAPHGKQLGNLFAESEKVGKHVAEVFARRGKQFAKVFAESGKVGKQLGEVFGGRSGGVRLALFGGKGGVGKTTTACAEAIRLAADKRVLLLSTDPAPSLGDALGVSVGDSVTRIPGTKLRARELDARAAFEKEKKKYREAIDDLFASIFRGRMDAAYDRIVLQDLLDLAPPGLDELFAVITIVDALDAKDWDVVVVDTAPTGHTLRLLELPEKALEWVHAIMQIILKYRRIVGLGDLARDLTTLAKQLRALMELLRDRKRCAFVAVTRAAELPRLETERLVTRLADLHVPLAALLVNGVTTRPSCAICGAASAAERPELERLAKVARPLVVAPAVWPPPRGARVLAAWRKTWV
jgi:arsenite-transporting ATPase